MPGFNLTKHFSLIVMTIKLQVEGKESNIGSHWLSEFKKIMKKIENVHLLNGNEGHSSSEFATTTWCTPQVGLSSSACEYSQPDISFPHALVKGLF